MIWTLVKKDLTYLTTSLKSTVVSIIVLGLFLSMAGIGFAISMPAFICYIGFYSVLAYEERSKMQLLNAALPVTRKEICLAKYIFAFLMIVFAMMLALAGTLMGYMAAGSTEALLTELPFYITLMGTGALIYISVMLPCVFYFGTMKARYVMMGIYILTFVFATNLNHYKMSSITGLLKGFGSPILLFWVAAIGGCLLSIAVSIRIWKKKDIN